jgi:hypothetical protein
MPSLMRCLAVISGVLLLGGCAPQTRFAWNNYDTTLYGHYKNPEQNEEFVEALKKIVAEAEAAKQVPPGIYAEYGYLLYEQGNNPMAISYLQKEADMWPESRAFMTKMIANIQKTKKNKDDKPRPAAVDDKPRSAVAGTEPNSAVAGTEPKQTDAARTEVSK